MRMVFVAGIGLAVFLEFLLASKKNKTGSDKILAVWMFLILIHLFLFYLYFTGNLYDFPFLLGTELPLPLFHGVFLYLYVASLTKQLPENRNVLAFHFVPVGLMYAYLVSFYLLPADQKILVYRNQGAGYELFNVLRSYAIACSGILYVVWSALLLKRHRSNIRDQFSNLERVNLRWLMTLTIGLGGIWFLVIVFENDVLIYSGVVVFVFMIGFFGVRQADIFAEGPVQTGKSEQKPKYLKSGLTEEISEELHRKLIRLMNEEALYKRSDLSINDLASILGVHPNYLSQVINQKEKKNFYDFVNTYRIDEFKRLIAIPENRQFTLLALAYDCGFNSKTAFNRYFKKATGQTPSEFSSSLSSS